MEQYDNFLLELDYKVPENSNILYCEYEIGSDDWNQRISQPKFIQFPQFAKTARGDIMLQGDHQIVAFANIKLLP